MKPVPDPLIIGLAGNAGVGKDTAAAYLQQRHHFEPFAFATPLRAMLEALLAECGLDHAYLYEPHLKAVAIPGLGLSYRELAQTLGTEWGRALDPDLWTRAAGLCLGLPANPIHDRIVLSDVRFPNEAHWVASQGGVIVRLHRQQAGAVRAHISEQLLDEIQPWACIDNSGSIAELHHQLDALIARLTSDHPTEELVP